jgi:cephalosporin-C deacetylase-like acetyl esterase
MATPEEAQAQSNAAMAALTPYLNQLSYGHLEQRAAAIAAISSRTEAERRQAEVRAKIIAFVRGIPKAEGPVEVRAFGRSEEDGFTIERIAYASCPDYWVTANVYVPPGPGPFPAMVMTVGHGAGKESLFPWAATLARAGVLVLAYDPMGQGERFQHFDPELGDSKLERLGEHEHANQASLLVGLPITRYWFADGIRAVDYLIGRGDVDAAHIGTFGCSGGGTAAAYLAAMDTRVSVAAVSSYITSFKALLPGNGPQDAEQTLPGFISSGLDFPDWVELAAPRAYAIVAYEQDFFPIAGAVQTFEEARRFYGHFRAGENIALIRGPGGHCNLPAVTPQLLAFLVRHLKGPHAPVPTFENVRPRDPESLIVTPTGQVLTSLPGKTIEDFARAALRPQGPPAVTRAAVDALRARLQTDIAELAGAAATPSPAVAVRTAPLVEKERYRIESVEFETVPGVVLPGRLALPTSAGPHPVVLWLDAAPLDKTTALADFDRLAASGHIVLALHLSGVLGEPDPNPNRLALGQYQTLALRPLIIGKTLVGLRVDDTRRAIAWLTALPETDRTRVLVYGRGAQGMVALHAAALESAITEVVIENTLVSYRAALQAGLRRNLGELTIPDVLDHYDTPELMTAISPRRVTVLNPANAMGRPMRLAQARETLTPALASARALGEPDRIRLQRRDPRDPLPIDAMAAGSN